MEYSINISYRKEKSLMEIEKRVDFKPYFSVMIYPSLETITRFFGLNLKSKF